jgi:RimJ/RimL family protein N-acetyltransferase
MPVFSLPHTAGPAPVIETERLRLRGYRLGDFADSLALWSDPIVYRYITGKPSYEDEIWPKFLRHVGHWALVGFGYWRVEEKATGRFVGEVGFADFKRVIEPSLQGIPEIGWVLASAMHGRGYGSEAVGAALAWGDAHFGSMHTACIVDPENAASLRLAAKFGYRELLRTTYLGDPTIMFTRASRGS